MDERTIVDADPRIRVGPGTRLNDLYEIDSLLAVGGMGEVYRGHVIETGDAVAIKTIRPDFAGHANALALFRKEASALHNVHHGAVVRYFVFSIDRRLDLPYLAMEYVDGESLAEILKRGPLAYEAVEILRRRLASGFQAAHEAGIVHRDVSPDNVILPAGDPARAKIIDFGIARSPLAGQTIIGDGFAGKHNYVSPEQFGLQGGDVTHKSDIYSLGLVLAETSLGRPLDMGSSPADFVARRSTVPDLTGIDSRLAPLLETMLRPDPRMRPESMADIAAWAPASRPVIAPPAVAARRSKHRLALGAAGAAVLAAVGAAVLLRPAVDDARGPELPVLVEQPRPAGGTIERPATSEEAIATDAKTAEARPAASRDGPAVPQELPAPVPAGPSAPRPQAPEPTEPKAEARPSGVIGPASRSPAVAAPTTKTAVIEPPTVNPELPMPRSPTMEDVAAYIRGYQGGSCFFLNPISVSRRDAAVEAYGQTAEPFLAFDGAFKAAIGFEAKIQLRQIEPGQCPLVNLLADQAAYKPASVPKLKLDRDRIASGEELRGTVDLGDDRSLRLMLVDGDGVVHDLTAYTTRNGRTANFAVRLEAPVPDQVRPQLLVAVGSKAPMAIGREGARSDQVSLAIREEASRPAAAVGLAVRYVKVGR